jgi:hypothetical protein
MSAVDDIAAVLEDLRRLGHGDPDALAQRDQILATKRALVRRLQHDDPEPPPPAATTLVCARPGCANPVTRRPGQAGRPPIYCSPACRPSRRHARDQISVEVDQDDGTSDGPHTGRAWTVTLRRGHRTVTVGRDLGRFAATALAGELDQLLHARTRHEGGPID